MGIFGELDADTIPDNPYWTRAGEYDALITSAYFDKDKGRNDQPQLIINYTITDDTTEFFNNEVRDRFDIYPDIDEDTLANLPPAEKKKILRSLSIVKKRLTALGQTDFTDPSWTPDYLVNLEVNLAVRNRGEDNQYSNVAWAAIKES